MADEQVKSGESWTPSTMIRRLGLEINNPESIYYWCAKNDIPVFSPALTDGAFARTHLLASRHANTNGYDIFMPSCRVVCVERKQSLHLEIVHQHEHECAQLSK
jgi:deoxyhypusine synthase